MEPACVEPGHDGWKGLQDPDPAQELQIDRCRLVHRDNKDQAPNFTTSDTIFDTFASVLGVTSGRKMSR
ncbi:hypothetical protein AHiyo6_18310 [Arthrobacter sp. Hiyo6]|nr:hypothetical protein AHiyo6_18310 [Arthrobacter sp. Hiyo6]